MLIEINLKKLLVILLACFSLSANAQIDESENFVYSYSDSVTYADYVRLRTDFLGYLQLRVDSRKVPLKQIKFFNTDEGFFANTDRLTKTGKGIAERVIQGRINLFQERTYRTFLNDEPYTYYHESPATVDVRMFYNKGYEDLRKVNYNNLKIDMADDLESLDLLEGYRKSKRTSTTLYVAAGVSIAAAVVSFLVSGKESQNSIGSGGFGEKPDMSINTGNIATSLALFGVGSGFAIGGYFVNQSGLRKLEGAIDSYNR